MLDIVLGVRNIEVSRRDAIPALVGFTVQWEKRDIKHIIKIKCDDY